MPIRWTVWGLAMEGNINNFSEILGLLQDRELITDSKQRIKAAGLVTTICTLYNVQCTFKFIFGCKLNSMIMKQMDKLSQTLQDPSLSSLE